MIRSFPMVLPRRRIGTDRRRSLLEVEWLEARSLPASGPIPLDLVQPPAIVQGSSGPSAVPAVAAGDATNLPAVTASAPSLTATVGVPIELTGSFTGLNAAIGNGSLGSSESPGDGSSGDPSFEFTWSNSGDQITYQYGYLHTYGAPGAYSYTITFNYNGANVATATGMVVVTAADPSNPVVTASAPNLTATAGVPVNLSASFTGPTSSIGAGILEEQPTFGDGSTDGSMNGLAWSTSGGQVTYNYSVSHTYVAPGVYTYTVAFFAEGNSLATATGTVTVSAGAASGQAGDPTPPPSGGVATGPMPAAVIATAPTPGTVGAAASVGSTASSRVPTVTISSGSAPAAPSGTNIDVILSELWAGLFTPSGSSSTVSSAVDLQSTSPTDPSQDPLLNWDKGLEILGL